MMPSKVPSARWPFATVKKGFSGVGSMLRYMDHLYTAGRWGLGLLFIYAGGRKLLAPEVFAVLIDAFGILPESLLPVVAILLPALEVAVGFVLLADFRGGLAAVTVLLVMFIVILGYALKMGLDVDCGCFGPQDPEARAFRGLHLSLYRNLALLLVVGWLYAGRRWRKRGLPRRKASFPR
ncbi:MAG: MauE/DoxX family redox-associated membrane protein [Desulfobacterales bacterium]